MMLIKSHIFDIYLKSGKRINGCHAATFPDLEGAVIQYIPDGESDEFRGISLRTDQIAAISIVCVTNKEGQPLEPYPLELF